MTETELNKGKELLQSIKYLENQKENWKNASDFDIIKIKHIGYLNSVFEVSSRFIDFESVRNQAIKNISKELEKLKTEFNNL